MDVYWRSSERLQRPPAEEAAPTASPNLECSFRGADEHLNPEEREGNDIHKEFATLALFCDMGLCLYYRHCARACIFASLNGVNKGEDTLDNVLGNCTSFVSVASDLALGCLGTVS